MRLTLKTALNLLIWGFFLALPSLELSQGKRFLDGLESDSVPKTSLGHDFSFGEEFERRNIYLPMISSGQLKKAVQHLALNIYHEARAEGVDGMLAVGWVTLNRVVSNRFPDSIEAVVFDGGERRNRCQFSWYCDGRSDQAVDPVSWKLALQLAEELLNAEHFDNTSGALFYYNPKKASPCWGESSSFLTEIGGHRFFGDIPWSEMRKLCRST